MRPQWRSSAQEVAWWDTAAYQTSRHGAPGGQCAPLTLQVVQLPCAVLPRDVLPVGAAGQGHHGAQRRCPLTLLHLELGQREERGDSARQSLSGTRGAGRGQDPTQRTRRVSEPQNQLSTQEGSTHASGQSWLHLLSSSTLRPVGNSNFLFSPTQFNPSSPRQVTLPPVLGLSQLPMPRQNNVVV